MKFRRPAQAVIRRSRPAKAGRPDGSLVVVSKRSDSGALARHAPGQGGARGVRVALEQMAAIPDDPPGSDEAFLRAVDEARPERPLFGGMY